MKSLPPRRRLGRSRDQREARVAERRDAPRARSARLANRPLLPRPRPQPRARQATPRPLGTASTLPKLESQAPGWEPSGRGVPVSEMESWLPERPASLLWDPRCAVSALRMRTRRRTGAPGCPAGPRWTRNLSQSPVSPTLLCAPRRAPPAPSSLGVSLGPGAATRTRGRTLHSRAPSLYLEPLSWFRLQPSPYTSTPQLQGTHL